MGDFKAFWTGTGIAVLMMAMGGCDTSERVQDPSGAGPTVGAKGIDDSSPFDRELIAAKNGNADPARREQAMMAILEKYGVRYPQANAGSTNPIPEASGSLSASSPALAKSAAAPAVRRDLSVSSADFETFVNHEFVGPHQTLALVAIGGAANVDPFLVAYIKEGNYPNNPVQVIGYNDDVSSDNRNSRIIWTNNSDAQQLVEIAAFAYSTAGRGRATVYQIVDGSARIFNGAIGGMHQYGATPPPAVPSRCVPFWTNISLQRTSGTGWSNALVVDTKAMRGGLLAADDRFPATQMDLPGNVDNPYPSFVLLYSNTGVAVSNYRFIQKDIYSCVN